MNHCKNTFRLFRYEMSRSWGGLLTTVIFFAYFGLIISPLIQDILAPGGKDTHSSWFGDFIYLTLTPNLGFIFTRSMLRYWENDSYTRKLAYWRTLPISLNAIVWSRMLQQAVMLVVSSLFFFTVQYAATKELRPMLDIGEFAAFSVVWMGYSLTLGASYAYFEQTMNGKRYLVACFAFIPLYIAAVLALHFAGVGVLLETLKAAEHHNIWLPAGSAAAGFAALIITGILLRKRLAARSLLG